MSTTSPVPETLRLNKEKNVLTVEFADQSYALRAEFLRVLSPSAEVQGHSPSTATLQLGKQAVKIQALEPVGQYGIKIVFDDGHDTGIYAWDTLYDYGKNADAYWHKYLKQVEQHRSNNGQFKAL